MTNQPGDFKNKLEIEQMRKSFKERNKDAEVIIVSTEKSKSPKAKKPISYKKMNALVRYILVSLVLSNVLLLTGNIINLVANKKIIALVMTIAAAVFAVVAVVFSVVVVVLFLTRRIM